MATAARAEECATEVERGDDAGSSYEVEIRKSDGTEVEVNVGPNFQVLTQSPDD
jgi:hypothetical protein